jgi:thioredoxin reductase
VVACQALAVRPRFVARGDVLAGLGLAPVEHPSGMGEHVPGDAFGATAVTGVWVAGNVTDLAASVVQSAAGGMTAATRINADLVADDTRRAVARRASLHPAGTRSS